MMRRPEWRLAGAAAVLMVGLTTAGCGNDDGDSSDESASNGPLSEFFGWDDRGLGDEPEYTEEERQQHYEIQDLIVACMNDAGFDYTPEQFYGDREEDFEDPFAEVWQMQEDDPERFAREYGYGLTTIDYESQAPETTDPAADDPNYAYRESLSAAAQEEYDQALWGEFEEFEEGETPAPTEPTGCQNEAYEQVYGDRSGEEEQFQGLFEEWDSLEQRIQDEPRMAAVKQAWSGCMATAGYPGLDTLYAGQDQVSERQSELYGWDEGGEGLLPSPIEGEAEGEGEAEEVPVETPPAPDPAALEELRQFERDIAVADYTCKQEHDVEGVERTVRHELETQFIEDHRPDLEAYRDWMNEQGIQG
jgi:hypothetical protein